MVQVGLHKQLMIFTNNELGSLAEISGILFKNNVHLLALCAYHADDNVSMMFVADDNNTAKDVLEKDGFDVVEEEVILLSVENKPGALNLVIGQLADAGVDLKLIYGGADSEGAFFKVVIITEDNLEAMLVIRTVFSR